MMLLLMMLTATTAWAATVQFPIYSGDEGTSGKPYQIKTIDDLNKLAADVNSGTNYEGKYFKLMNDLDFYEATNTALRPTTAWNDATSQENNFTRIGLYSGTTANRRYFCGHFDGNGMTIRGIRIYSTETSMPVSPEVVTAPVLWAGTKAVPLTAAKPRPRSPSSAHGLMLTPDFLAASWVATELTVRVPLMAAQSRIVPVLLQSVTSVAKRADTAVASRASTRAP